MHEAQFYIKGADLKVECQLCPFYCVLNEGQTGNCKVRVSKNGKLFTLVYNKIAALGIDPIEKKPLYHFYPGTTVFSLGSVGCNFNCDHCQNFEISGASPEDITMNDMPPKTAVDLAKKHINAKKKQGFISKSFLEKTLSKGQLKLCDECGEEIDPIFYKKINEWGRNEGGWDNSTKCVGYQKVLCIPCQIEHKLYKKKLNQKPSK